MTRMMTMLLPAAIVTFSLQMVMVSLIKFADHKLDKSPTLTLPDIAMPEQEIKTLKTVEKPEKPVLDETPPPEVPMQAFDNLDGAAQVGALGELAQVAELDLSMGDGLAGSDGEYLPIVKVAPVYPQRALKRGLEGEVLLSYTVSKSGTVVNPVVVQSTHEIFDKAAIDSALRYKYKPRVVDGVPVEVPGVQTVIKFRMQK